MIIASSQNEKIKHLKKLMNDKSLVFFDNPKLIEEAKQSGHKVLYVIKREDVPYKTDYGGEIIEVTQNVFNQFSDTINSQGLIGVVQFIPKPIAKPKGCFLVLDGLQDPGNVGTLIRSALGANFLDIYLLDCVKATNSKVIRSSMGAFFKTNIYQLSRSEFIDNFKLWDLPLLACDMNGKNIFEYNSSGIVGVVVGNEGNGLSKEIKSLATDIVKIPMQNNLESLNAGVSGSLVMYQIATKINKN